MCKKGKKNKLKSVKKSVKFVYKEKLNNKKILNASCNSFNRQKQSLNKSVNRSKIKNRHNYNQKRDKNYNTVKTYNNISKKRKNSYNKHKKRWRLIVSYNNLKENRKRIVKHRRKSVYRYRYLRKNNKFYRRLLVVRWIINRFINHNKYRLSYYYIDQGWS